MDHDKAERPAGVTVAVVLLVLTGVAGIVVRERWLWTLASSQQCGYSYTSHRWLSLSDYGTSSPACWLFILLSSAESYPRLHGSYPSDRLQSRLSFRATRNHARVVDLFPPVAGSRRLRSTGIWLRQIASMSRHFRSFASNRRSSRVRHPHCAGARLVIRSKL